MAAYSDTASRFEALKTQIVAISVDTPAESAALRDRLGLAFPLLCDNDKSLITAWGALNAKKRDGVAHPSSWVLDRDLVVQCRILERTRERADPEPILSFLAGRVTADEVHTGHQLMPPAGASLRWVGNALGRLRRGKKI